MIEIVYEDFDTMPEIEHLEHTIASLLDNFFCKTCEQDMFL